MDVLRTLVNAVFRYSGLESGLLPRIDTPPVIGEEYYVTAPTNLNREILYESFISIDSMVFVSEMNQFSSETLEDFIKKTVLVAKTLLLESPECFDQFSNYQDRVSSSDKRLRSALELRNKYFNADKSSIGRELTMEKYKALRSRVGAGPPGLYYEDEDRRYVQMMSRLMSAKYEDHGIYRAIARETGEFYGEKIKVPDSLALDSRVSLSIGGSIFVPGLLLALMKELNIPNKQGFISNALPRILGPSSELVSRMHLKSPTERRETILEFLQSCLRRKEGEFKAKIDEGFEERTKILETYLDGDPESQEKLRVLDRLQEEEINKLISVFRSVDEEDLVLRLDKSVTEAYGDLLNYGQKSARALLYDLFR